VSRRGSAKSDGKINENQKIRVHFQVWETRSLELQVLLGINLGTGVKFTVTIFGGFPNFWRFCPIFGGFAQFLAVLPNFWRFCPKLGNKIGNFFKKQYY
jgi:hypothetical protein